jgi:citrate lyase subunit beta/citryl-CoA lyase
MLANKHHIYPGWRSALFIPVHREAFVDNAAQQQADAYILDLEDSVPVSQKELARRQFTQAAKHLSTQGLSVLARINIACELYQEDLHTVVSPEVSAIVLPKVSSSDVIQQIAGAIKIIEQKKRMPLGHTLLIAMVESVHALDKLDEIACAHSRLVAMMLGSEDFSESCGMTPNLATLALPSQMLCFAARRAHITPLGLLGSIANYQDIDVFKLGVENAKEMGFEGTFCIHPNQVLVVNEVFTPSEEEIREAKQIVDVYERGLSEGMAAEAYNGRMIESPSVKKARHILRGL